MSRPVIERARADLANGRPWKARDRLQGALRTSPHDAAVLNLLGDVLWGMGDHPAAARYWILVGRRGADADTARWAFEERTGRDLGLQLREIHAVPPLEAYPAEAQGQLALLAAAADGAGLGPWPRVRERPEMQDVEPWDPLRTARDAVKRVIGR
ncbi:MAG: hypothetical protein JHC95_08570 [Solirubrobacteraceae bacterium]|nr:hypothetical protein [Solirubrobacteraceae bacterium]